MAQFCAKNKYTRPVYLKLQDFARSVDEFSRSETGLTPRYKVAGRRIYGGGLELANKAISLVNPANKGMDYFLKTGY
ncbi:MAG: hypothetical protein EB100_01150 [Crocinitomicaceae bacterium]|nr:hypothetical protein [Crocinitomicaceae bacterium]